MPLPALLRILVLTLLTPGFAAAIPAYQAIDLGGKSALAQAINDQGQVTGQTSPPGSTSVAFIGDTSGMQVLGTLGGPFSSGYGINNEGTVVGTASTETGGSAFIGNASGIRPLLNSSGESAGFPTTINNQGDVAGFIGNAFNRRGGFILRGNDYHLVNMRDIWDMNDHGIATGTGTGLVEPYGIHAYIGNEHGVKDLGTLGGSYGIGRGINNFNQVAGISELADGRMHAFIADSEGMRPILDTEFYEESYAYDINDLGQIVGYTYTVGEEGRLFPFLWDPTEGLFDLNDLIVNADEWAWLSDAWAINNSGQIAGMAGRWVGDTVLERAVIFDPIEGTKIDEPHSLPLLVLGLALLLTASARNKPPISRPLRADLAALATK